MGAWKRFQGSRRSYSVHGNQIHSMMLCLKLPSGKFKVTGEQRGSSGGLAKPVLTVCVEMTVEKNQTGPELYMNIRVLCFIGTRTESFNGPSTLHDLFCTVLPLLTRHESKPQNIPAQLRKIL